MQQHVDISALTNAAARQYFYTEWELQKEKEKNQIPVRSATACVHFNTEYVAESKYFNNEYQGRRKYLICWPLTKNGCQV